MNYSKTNIINFSFLFLSMVFFYLLKKHDIYLTDKDSKLDTQKTDTNSINNPNQSTNIYFGCFNGG